MLGERHPDIAQSYGNLAKLYQVRGDFTEAERLLTEAVEIDEQVYGKYHPDLAKDLISLAELLRERERLAEAESHYRRAWFILKDALGDQSPQRSKILNDYASLLRKLGFEIEAAGLDRGDPPGAHRNWPERSPIASGLTDVPPNGRGDSEPFAIIHRSHPTDTGPRGGHGQGHPLCVFKLRDPRKAAARPLTDLPVPRRFPLSEITLFT